MPLDSTSCSCDWNWFLGHGRQAEDMARCNSAVVIDGSGILKEALKSLATRPMMRFTKIDPRLLRARREYLRRVLLPSNMTTLPLSHRTRA